MTETFSSGASEGGSGVVPPLLFAPFRLPVKCFSRVFEEGRNIACGALVLRYLPNSEGVTRIGVIASKRTFRRAVDRSRARRLLREAFRLERPQLKVGYDLIVLGRGKLLEMKCDEVRRALYGVCRKVKLLKGK